MWPFSKKEKRNVAPIFFTNTLTSKKELFVPLKPGVVSMYSCGPTVYSKQHIGNLKAPLFADIIARILLEAGYHVRRVINITDVGHLVSDADEGEDKMEKGARLEGIVPQEIAVRYTGLFQDDLRALNVATSDILWPKATEYIREQIAMIKTLEEQGHTYRTKDGLYFDTETFPGYGKLGGVADATRKEVALADLGRRIKENKEKRHAADFALWKFAAFGTERLQEWPSPWGTGFPGWHIECSAMSRALLGDQLDIHTGGMDHIPIHHNNEIAQSESVTGKPFVRYWMHEAFITIEGEKISKSLKNEMYLSDIEARGFHPLSLRYLFLSAHYRTPMSFTWESIAAADEALKRLWRACDKIAHESKRKEKDSDAARRLIAVVRDDLATPQALALLWESIADESLSSTQVWGLIVAADRIFGLSLTNPPADFLPIPFSSLPVSIQTLVKQREEARKKKDFAVADAARIHIEAGGYHVEDTADGPLFTKTSQ